ncbi:MAG: hypothetical protein M1814_004999 [Vezdaea aestivalis]|nr:MAG: hypothetical protein M1814_004999 [Vezdaea aestivalis]
MPLPFVALLHIFTLLNFTHLANAVYDPNKPYLRENLDPDQANPIHSISCVGTLPLFPLPKSRLWDPNEATLQEVCAKSQYGGYRLYNRPIIIRAALSLQGFCEASAPGTETEDPNITSSVGTVFDFFWLGRNTVIPEYLRLALYCRERCFCNSYPQPVSDKPRGPGNSQVSFRPRTETYQIEVDVPPNFARRPEKYVGTDTESVLSTTLREVSQLDLDRNAETIPSQDIHVSIDPGNYIQCLDVPLPAFLRDMPPPFNPQDFENTQQLCAVALSGGDPRANAGGYCHRRYSRLSFIDPRNIIGQVWYAEDMTPRKEWTWESDHLRFVISLRFFCWQQCSCSNVVPDVHRDRLGARIWPLAEDVQVIKDNSGAIHLLKRDQNGKYSFVALAADGWEAPFPFNSLPADSLAPLRWDPAILGAPPGLKPPPPILEPRLIPLSTSGLSPAAKSEPLPRCGQECAGPAERSCSGAASAEGACKCVLPSSRQAASLGLDPVAPKALCLVLAGTRLAVEGVRRKGVMGRDVGVFDEEWACVCNVTYSSSACCKSADGLVWENRRLGMGELV